MAGFRWRRIPATLPAVVQWMTEGSVVMAECVSGLPRGTVCVGTIQEDLNRVSLVVEHESFDEIKTAPLTKDAIPEHPMPMFRTREQQQQAIEDRSLQAMRGLCADLGINEVAKESAENIRAILSTSIKQLQTDLAAAKRAPQQLKDRIVELEVQLGLKPSY